MPRGDFHAYAAEIAHSTPWLPPDVTRRLLRTYGTRIEDLLGGASSLSELGAHYGDGVYEAEISYLLCHEWLETVEDLLWRRTKLGLVVSEATVERLRQRLSAAG